MVTSTSSPMASSSWLSSRMGSASSMAGTTTSAAIGSLGRRGSMWLSSLASTTTGAGGADATVVSTSGCWTTSVVFLESRSERGTNSRYQYTPPATVSTAMMINAIKPLLLTLNSYMYIVRGQYPLYRYNTFVPVFITKSAILHHIPTNEYSFWRISAPRPPW